MFVGDEDVPRLQHAFATFEIGGDALCFAHHQDAGRDIPCCEPMLPECVVTPCRRPGEIERRRTEAANARRRIRPWPAVLSGNAHDLPACHGP